MRAAVVLRETLCIGQTKIAGEVDHFHVGRKSWRNLHRLSMRQSEKRAIKIRETLKVLWRFGEFQIRHAEKIAMHFADRFPGLFIRGNDSNLSGWVRQQN